jgi:hypothetical protein
MDVHSHVNNGNEAFFLAVKEHNIPFILSLAPRFVLGDVNCTYRCTECAYVRSVLFDLLPLEEDFKRVRALIRKARLDNCFVMQRPRLMMHPATDVIACHIFRTSRFHWNKATACVFAVLMWNAWKRRQLHPDSRYVKGLALRFRARC